MEVNMKKKILIVLVAIIISFYQGTPVYADDSIDTQILNNDIEALIFLKNQDYEEAIRYFTKSIELDPNNIITLFHRSACYCSLKNYDASIKDLNLALSLNPKNTNVLYNKAIIYSLMNDKEAALQLLQQVIFMDGTWKKTAISDKNLDNIRDSEQFRSLTGTTVLIDGNAMQSDTGPVVIGGRTLVPLRSIFEALGATVKWDADNNAIFCTKDKTSITLHIDNIKANINDKLITLDTPATVINNRTFVPLRFVAESLGASVNWLEDTQEVYITSPDDNTSAAAVNEKKIMEVLKNKLDYCPIDGAYIEPFGMDKTKGLVIFVAKSQEDLLDFQSLSDGNKKIFLNDYVQAHWGDFIGCKSVRIYFVYNGKRYVETVTGYQTPASDLPLYRFKQGIDTSVIVQDKNNSFYYDYYQNNKPKFNRANAKITTFSEELIPHKIYFNYIPYATISYPKSWKVVDEGKIVYFFSPLDGNNDSYSDNVNIHVHQIPKEMIAKLSDPASFIEYTKQQSASNLTDFKIETAKLDISKDWGKGYLFIYTARIDQEIIKGKSYVLVYNNGLEVFYELYAQPKNYTKINIIFEAMLTTLKFEKE
jgi:hypothetical protein